MRGGAAPVLLALLVTVNAVVEQCGQSADVAFVIDSSSSIWIYDFHKQIKFVQDLVNVFDIGPDATHVAALTFSDQIGREFYFDKFNTAEDVIDRVGNITHVAGKTTFTHDALEIVRTDLFSTSNGARANVPKICILLTDGKSTYSSRTLEQAAYAKDDGIKILAIGIGSGVNDGELREVVSPPADKNYFYRHNFNELGSVVFQELIGQTACEVIKTTVAPKKTTTTTAATTTTTATTTTMQTTSTESITTTEMPKDRPDETCQGKEADIVFIIDMSSSIWVEHFKQQLQFLSNLVSSFDIDSGKTKVAMVMFSDEAKTQFYLDKYNSRVEVSKAILHVKSEGGITNTHLALKKLLDEMFTRQHGSRPGVAHICILITDGRSSKPELTLPEAELVHDSGVYVFAIGVGNMTDRLELEQMASKPEFAFEVKNGYNALSKIKNILAYKTCEVPQNDELKCAKDIHADIMFGLYGISGADRDRVTEFVKSVGAAVDLSSGNVRIGLRETCGKAKLALSEFEGSWEFSKSVSNAMASDMSGLLYDIRKEILSSRENAVRIGILVISGKVEDMDKAYLEDMRMKNKVRMIVIGLGKGFDPGQLKKLASYKNTFEPDTSHVFQVNDSADLPFVVKKLHVLMCKEQ